MDLLFVFLVLSLLVMLSFTAIFYRLSLYNGSVARYRFPKWEKLLLNFMLLYPACSLVLVFILDNIINPPVINIELYRTNYLMFAGAHIFLSIAASVVSLSLRKDNNLYFILSALNIVTGILYGISMMHA